MRNLTASARPKRSLRQRDRDRAGGQVFVLDEIQAIRADLGWPQEIGRSAEMTREPGDLVGIRELGAWCEVEDLHVLGHAAAKCGHGQLHCEMKSATRRRRTISQAGWYSRRATAKRFNPTAQMIDSPAAIHLPEKVRYSSPAKSRSFRRLVLA